MNRTAIQLLLLVLAVLCPSAFCQDRIELDDNDARPLAAIVDAFRNAETLYYESDYKWSWSDDGKRIINRFTYRCWLKKPNFFRVEIRKAGDDDLSGILVGDGERLWTYWPNGRPRYQWEDWGDFAKDYEKNRFTSFKTKLTPRGKHSIGHEVMAVGGMFMPVFDPSTFHGHKEALLALMDEANYTGEEVVNGQTCSVIEVSFGKKQRTWRLAVSKADSIPRKLMSEQRNSSDMVVEEEWSNVTLNGSIDDSKFQWKPPYNWRELKEPPIEAGLLRPGSEAPDFALKSLNGKTVRLKDFRGKNVWLFKWRIG